jgi:hypothetical protein
MEGQKHIWVVQRLHKGEWYPDRVEAFKENAEAFIEYMNTNRPQPAYRLAKYVEETVIQELMEVEQGERDLEET